MSGDTTASKTDDEKPGSKEFYCLNCHSPGRHGMDHCLACGTRYVWEDVPDDDAERGEAAEGNVTDDVESLFNHEAIECGYFDVEGGVFAFTGPTCSNRYELSECQNCGTLLEVPVKSCPLCGGALKRIMGGVAALVSGAVTGGGIDADPSGQLFCQSCGDMATPIGGRCNNCGSRLTPQSENLSNPVLRMMPSESISFVHLNVESGMMECLSKSDRPESAGFESERFREASPVTDIDTFGRIRMMFDEQTSTIIGLTSEKPMTASDICHRLNIPRSVCYRKLKMLTDARLLNLCKDDKESGNWQISRYLSNIDMVYVALEHGDMNMVLRLKDSGETQKQRFSSESR